MPGGLIVVEPLWLPVNDKLLGSATYLFCPRLCGVVYRQLVTSLKQNSHGLVPVQRIFLLDTAVSRNPIVSVGKKLSTESYFLQRSQARKVRSLFNWPLCWGGGWELADDDDIELNGGVFAGVSLRIDGERSFIQTE